MILNDKIIVLGIESSCDDTSAAVIRDGYLLSNIIAGQKVHEAYGGVVPELASRAHQQNIVPVVDAAIKRAAVSCRDISAVAFTRGPGLPGSLLVGASFAKGFALSLGIPLIGVNHLQGHVLAHFIREQEDTGSTGGQPSGAATMAGKREQDTPRFPHLCLLVSGGNSQIILVKDYLEMEVIGQTIDDAAGEAFDKCAKVMGMPYPGGPLIDKLAAQGNPSAFTFAKPRIGGFDYSFSGLKTSFLYFLRDKVRDNENYIDENKADLCASLQKTITDILLDKLVKASNETGIREITVAGGVSANSGLQNALKAEAINRQWNLFIPKFEFTTDNAAMIAITGYYKYMKGQFTGLDAVPFARMNINE